MAQALYKQSGKLQMWNSAPKDKKLTQTDTVAKSKSLPSSPLNPGRRVLYHSKSFTMSRHLKDNDTKSSIFEVSRVLSIANVIQKVKDSMPYPAPMHHNYISQHPLWTYAPILHPILSPHVLRWSLFNIPQQDWPSEPIMANVKASGIVVHLCHPDASTYLPGTASINHLLRAIYAYFQDTLPQEEFDGMHILQQNMVLAARFKRSTEPTALQRVDLLEGLVEFKAVNFVGWQENGRGEMDVLELELVLEMQENWYKGFEGITEDM